MTQDSEDAYVVEGNELNVIKFYKSQMTTACYEAQGCGIEELHYALGLAVRETVSQFHISRADKQTMIAATKEYVDFDAGRYVAEIFAEAEEEAAKLEAMGRLNGNGQDPLRVVDASEYMETDPPPTDEIIKECFEVGDKVLVVGSSKVRKSFFVLQLGISLAAGEEFLGMQVPKQRKVLICQLEIQPKHFHRRVKYMTTVLGVESEDVIGNLKIINGRVGFNIDILKEKVREIKPDVVIIDPIYKLMQEGENDVKEWKPLLASFDNLCQTHNLTIIYVHHDAKGTPGLRAATDRGSGSGVLARDYDASFILTPQKDHDDCLVLQQVVRNFRGSPAITVDWKDYQFQVSDKPAVVETKIQANKGIRSSSEAQALIALKLLQQMTESGGEVFYEDFIKEMGGTQDIGRRKAIGLIKMMIDDERMEKTEGLKTRRHVLHLTSVGGSYLEAHERKQQIHSFLKEERNEAHQSHPQTGEGQELGFEWDDEQP